MQPPPDDIQEERRKAPRLETDLEVDCAAEGTFLVARVTDLSWLGIFMQTDELLAVGTALTLRFRPPDETREVAGRPSLEPFELRGEVVWTTVGGPTKKSRTGMGIRFIDITRAQRDRLHGLFHAVAYLRGEDS